MNTENKDRHPATLWFDLDNSPHVPFFFPIIKRFGENHHTVFITARDCFQVCGLADYYKLDYTRIGRHYGKNKALKVVGTLFRALQLLPIIAKTKPDIALSHGSRAMIIAANIRKIPCVVMTDYEFANKPPLVKLSLVIVPEVLEMDDVATGNTKVVKYPGIKEDVYVPFFKPDGSIQRELNLTADQIVVTIRPPATEAHYHNPESEILFSEVLNLLAVAENVKMVILPRNEIKQTAWIKDNWPGLFASGKAVIPSTVLDGLNLIWHSDLVVSGGGTMNREAAALGVPVYSIFRGRIGAVDRFLAQSGRLCLLETKDDVRQKIRIAKRCRPARLHQPASEALDAIMRAVIEVIEHQQPSGRRADQL